MLENIDAQTKEKIREKIQHLREEAQHLSEKAREAVQYLLEKAGHYKEDAKEILDDASEYIKKNPQRSVMIAGAVGAMIGMIFGLLIRGNRNQ